MLIDFHTHSSASDGALDPRELVRRGLEREIELLAITDHDTLAGYFAVADHCRRAAGPLRLVPGIEFSCQWSGTTIHILGLGFDATHPVLRDGVATMTSARRDRGVKIAQKLAAKGFKGALEGALERAGESQLGRPHFAQWMVDQGHSKDFTEAFDRYLGQGKVGDVKAFWPEMATVTQWINAAGGVALIAHPLKYRFTAAKLRRLTSAFVAAQGAGLEVLSGRQTPDQTAQLLRLAREFGLEISIGSDFHRDSTYGPLLGVELPHAPGLRGVWERWQLPRHPDSVLNS